MYLKARLIMLWHWLSSPELTDFVVIQMIRWIVHKHTGRKDKDFVINWMETHAPQLWEQALKEGLKVKDEYFV
jgi:hypothetical protein